MKRRRDPRDAVESAARCTREDTNESLIASVQVSARISDAELAILEAKSDERVQGDFRCEVNMAPRTTKACTGDEMESDCFVLDGTTLTIYGSSPSRRSR